MFIINIQFLKKSDYIETCQPSEQKASVVNIKNVNNVMEKMYCSNDDHSPLIYR